MRKSVSRIIWMTVMLFNSIFAYSQRAGYQLYTIDDGLVQSEVTRIFQDRKGFLWVGTKNGISRFDGHTFQTIRDSAGISDAWVTHILQPNDSVVFFMTRKGFLSYTYGKTADRIFSRDFARYFAVIWSWRGEVNMIVNEDQETVLYTVNGSELIRKDTSFLDKLRPLLPFSGSMNFAFSGQDSHCYFRAHNGQLGCLTSAGEVVMMEISSFLDFFYGEDGSIFVITPNERFADYVGQDYLKNWDGFKSGLSENVRILKLNGTSFTLVRDLGPQPSLLQSNFCFLNSDTIYISDPSGPSLLFLGHNEMVSARLDFAASVSLYLDRERNLWAGSPLGLLRFFPLAFTHYTEKDGLYPNVQSILQDRNGTMIAGAYEKGFQKLENGAFSPIPPPSDLPGNMKWFAYPGGRTDKEGILHLCVTPYCYFLWDGQKLTSPKDLPIGSAMYYVEDPVNGMDYYGTNLGLLQQKKGESGYRMEAIFPGNKINHTVAMLFDNQRRLWMGGFNGLTVADGDSLIVFPNDQYPYSFGANALTMDHRQTIWIGNTDGLWLFDNKRFRKVINPWFNDLVVSLAVVNRSWLFIGGVHGIGFLNLDAFYYQDSVDIRYFNANNGFSGRECQQNAVCIDQGNNVWVATTHNLQRIDPEMLPGQLDGPDTYITRISVLDDRMNYTPLVSTPLDQGEITLTYNQANLRFDFTAIWFRGPAFVRFRYRLTGQDAGWSPVTTERFATYTNLSPGQHQFQVMACNEYGQWTDIPASVTVTIHPAYWQTWWFFVLAVLLSVALVSGSTWLVLHRTRRRKQRELLHKQLVAELQFKTFRNQLAPHFIFNALNAIGSTIYRNELKQSYDLLHKFSRLIRSTLVHAEKTSRTMAEELEFVQYYLEIEKIRFEGKIDYRFDIEKGIDVDQQVPRMIIQTFVENSVKHGLMHKEEGGLIVVKADNHERFLRITIEDNGIGRDASAKFRGDSTGKGMEIIREFIRLFNTFNAETITVDVIDLMNSAGEPSGTRVVVSLPVHYTYTFENDTKECENRTGG